ncbi:MAG: response regulator [Myxococcaceae bacterium]|nr:response regulator [Myxococcaceae bacterium]
MTPSEGRGPRRRVLVVDDEALLRRSTCRLLEALGHEAVSAADGAEAEARLREMPELDVVVLDLLMPGWPVEQTFAALRTLRPAMPIVLCSGVGAGEHAARLLEQPFVTQLQKPFTIDELGQVIGAMLSRA